MKANFRLLWLPALCFSTGFTWSQVFPQESGSGPKSFYEFFYENGIGLPQSFIHVEKSTSNLYVADPKQVLRADRVELKVPGPVESKGPHVFEKLGMMAEAMDGDFDDEEAFMKNMRSGIWQQAQAVLKAGF